MTVQEYIYEYQNKAQKQLMQLLHNFLTQQFELEPKIRYKIPFYDQYSWICYLNPISNEGVELAFIHGQLLSNIQGLLNSKGRKQVSGISFYQEKDIPYKSLTEIVLEAMILDERNTKK